MANFVKAADMAQLTPPQSGEEVAILQTNMGDIVIRLFPEQCPRTVENFVTHIRNGYYDGIIFHRVINDFMIQGGDPTGTGRGGESIWGTQFENECERNLFNFRGALSMANAGPNTNGSQFFIVQTSSCPYRADDMARHGWPQWAAQKYTELGGTPYLDGGLSPQGYAHTVFGQVFRGMEIVDAIAAVQTNASDRPLKDVVIERAVMGTMQ